MRTVPSWRAPPTKGNMVTKRPEPCSLFISYRSIVAIRRHFAPLVGGSLKVNGTVRMPAHLLGAAEALENQMKNLGLLTAGILGAAVLTTTVAFAVSQKNRDVTAVEVAELDGDTEGRTVRMASLEERRGISEEELESRIAAERADARAEAEAAARAKAACEKARQNASNQGAVVGGVAGAVIGSQVAGSGAKSEGGVLGGVAGVLAGRQIARDQNRC